jgi:hypothetical protein
MIGKLGKWVQFSLVSAICLAGSIKPASAQGITGTPRPPTRPAASEPPVKTDDHAKQRNIASVGAYSDPTAEGSTPTTTTPVQTAPADGRPATNPPSKATEIKIDLHGGAWLFYWQPFGISTDPVGKARGLTGIPDEGAFFRMHQAHLNFDGSIGNWGLFFNASVRDTKMREFYEGTAWVEEGYIYYKHPQAFIKIGKSYNRFSLFWDNSFYGNVQFYDGIKLDPDYGISLEGSVGKEKGPRLGYFAQYFIVDGRTNGSYVGRDTISIPRARRRHMAVARLEPSYFWSKEHSITLGLSGEYFQADLPNPVGKKDVFRFGGDLYANIGPISFWADYFRQLGQSVTEWPIPPSTDPTTGVVTPGKASATNDYILVGAEARIKKLVLRYNFSAVRYQDVAVSEFFHVPGIGFNMNDYLQFLVEFAYWNQKTITGQEALFDRTIATTIHAYF